MADEEEIENEDGDAKGFIALLSVFFLPAMIVAGCYYLMLRRGKHRLSVIALTVLIVDVLTLLLMLIFHAWGSFSSTISEVSSLRDTWTSLLPFVLGVNVVLGGFLGLGAVYWEIKQMEESPHLLQLPGSWRYKFKFRRTPWELRRRDKLVKQLKSGELYKPGVSPLGLAEDEEEFRVVNRFDSEAVKHFLITGTSGSGKSITMQSLILSDIKAGTPVILVDFKRSPEFAAKLALWSERYGANFYHFVNGKRSKYNVPHSRGQSLYDPLHGGTPGTRADMVLGMRQYDVAAEMYKSHMQELLQVIFSMLDVADRRKAPGIDWDGGGIYQLFSALTPGNLQQLAIACEGTSAQESAADIYEQAQGKDMKHTISQLRGQLRTIIASEYGPWLKTDGEAENVIDLFEITSNPKNVVLFSLNSDSEPEFAKYIGALIMADVTNMSAERRNKGMGAELGVHVYVDEFQAMEPTTVNSLLEKSRASGLSVTLAQQSLEQSVKAAGEAYLVGILETCSNFIIHAGSTQHTAERLAGLIGKQKVDVYRATNKHKSSFLKTNRQNRRNQIIQTSQEEQWIVNPSRFMRLSAPDENNNWRSTAMIINKTSSDPVFEHQSGAVARHVWMIPSDEVLEKIEIPLFGNNNEDDEVAEKATISMSKREISSEETSPRLSGKSVREESGSAPVLPDDEEDDGGFYFERIEDDDLDEDLRSAILAHADEPLVLGGVADEPQATAASGRSSRPKVGELSVAERLWEEEKPLPRKAKVEKPAKPAKAKPPKKAAPAPVVVKVEDLDDLPLVLGPEGDEEEEEFTLPDLGVW